MQKLKKIALGLFKFLFAPSWLTLMIYLGTRQITPRWPTIIVGFGILAIYWRYIDRKALS